MPKIPRVMSTQHPDNVRLPFFAESPDMSGQDEIKEAYYAFSHLGCEEQMWDCEGKEVDAFVVRKLLTRYEHFFKEKKLGQDVFITLRVPNPTVEKAEAKVLIETLEEIPRSFDSARLFYNEDIPPIFEVILPMTTTSKCLNRIYYYYKDFIAGKQNQPFYPGDITIAEWVGEFKPETIQVIPLFEDREHILECDQILREYLKDKKVPYQRVFLARSDPAMNYGMVSAVLCNKIALQRLRRLSRELDIEIYPILGVGSAPFRGNLKPGNEDRVLFEYPDVQTYTAQSAFKYDYPVDLTIKAVEKLRTSPRRRGWEVDEKRCISIIDKVSAEYRRQVEALAPLINQVAGYVPGRRMRKLHVGLFGYSRSIGKVTLPRAISFCAACYSIGLPPEILGLNALDRDDLAYLKEAYIYFADDLGDGLSYLKEFQIKPWQEKIVSVYRGPGGKGSAFRSAFEAAKRLKVKACIVVDADLRSITSDWVKYLLEPILEKDYQYVSPVYTRYKYDGTITNNVVYNLTRALYGLRIRQPIGGDFAFAGELAAYYMEQDVWDTDVARYGIDIWMTTNAITSNFKICQSNLGVKVHDAKDPAESIGPMFRQVVHTLCVLMEQHETEWKAVRGSRSVPLFGVQESVEPEPIHIDLGRLVTEYKAGFRQFKGLYRDIFCAECFEELKRCASRAKTKFVLPVKTWVMVLYETAATFHRWTHNRAQLVNLVTPLYLGRVASFINETRKMTSSQTEELVEEQAQVFEDHKDYLIQVWDEKKEGP